jgi:TonB family protein
MVCLGITHYIVETLFMKFTVLILLSIGFCPFINAQPTKKVVNESRSGWPSKTETYYVLKSDKTIRHGSYELLRMGAPVIEGYYNNGKKDSLWETYGDRGVLLSKKWYVNGVKKGIWEFYSRDGEQDWQYDFTTGKITYQKPRTSPDTATHYYLAADSQWTRAKLDIAPKLLYSSGEWLSFLNRTLRYPNEAVDKGQMGTVMIAVTLDETGNAIDYSVFTSAAPALDQEALRVVKLAENEYLPAEKDGKKVRSMYLLPIVFKLEVNK